MRGSRLTYTPSDGEAIAARTNKAIDNNKVCHAVNLSNVKGSAVTIGAQGMISRK
jgi:hypothetical protein